VNCTQRAGRLSGRLGGLQFHPSIKVLVDTLLGERGAGI
jgi:hypothetical protein